MNVCLLASGSKGNSLVVDGGGCRLLIDAGLSARELYRRLASVDVPPESLDAILVTHEHIDHVRGLGVLSRRLGLPVFMHHAIAAPLADGHKPARLVEFDAGTDFCVGDLKVRAFSVTHDAAAPVGFVI